MISVISDQQLISLFSLAHEFPIVYAGNGQSTYNSKYGTKCSFNNSFTADNYITCGNQVSC